VAHRISLRQLRDRVSSNETVPIEPTIDDDSPLEKLARRSDEETVDNELQRMPQRYRNPLVLHYLEERSYQEIADELGITLSAVTGRIKRGRADLRRRLLRRGITLSGFVAIVSSSQLSAASLPTEALVHSVVENSIAFANGTAPINSISHHLAQLEQVNMMLPITKVASLSAVALIAIGFGSYGAVNLVSAQSPPATAQGVQVQAVQQPTTEFARTTVTGFEALGLGAQNAANQLPLTTFGSRSRMAVERIEQILVTGSLEFKYLDEQLSVVLSDLQARLKIPVIVDTPALEDYGIGTDTPVTIQVSGISTRSALRLLLDQFDLTYVIANEVILITTAEEAESRLDTRVYDVADTGITTNSLIEVISKVKSDSWSETGGPGHITAATNSTLVIAQTQRIHEQIVDLLEQLKRVSN
jgi:hypothetical protein